jgi:hypothetical protein
MEWSGEKRGEGEEGREERKERQRICLFVEERREEERREEKGRRVQTGGQYVVAPAQKFEPMSKIDSVRTLV